MIDDTDDIARGMASIRKALDKRLRLAARADELAAREQRTRPVRSGELAAFDMRGLARRLRPILEFDGRGWRALAAEIGVTASDLSRVMAGQDLAYQKVRAICEWAGLDPDRFYRRPAGAPRPRKTPRRTLPRCLPKSFTGKALKQGKAARLPTPPSVLPAPTSGEIGGCEALP